MGILKDRKPFLGTYLLIKGVSGNLEVSLSAMKGFLLLVHLWLSENEWPCSPQLGKADCTSFLLRRRCRALEVGEVCGVI